MSRKPGFRSCPFPWSSASPRGRPNVFPVKNLQIKPQRVHAAVQAQASDRADCLRHARETGRGLRRRFRESFRPNHRDDPAPGRSAPPAFGKGKAVAARCAAAPGLRPGAGNTSRQSARTSAGPRTGQ